MLPVLCFPHLLPVPLKDYFGKGRGESFPRDLYTWQLGITLNKRKDTSDNRIAGNPIPMHRRGLGILLVVKRRYWGERKMPTIVAERRTVFWELWGVGVIRQKLNQIWAEHRQSSPQIAVICDFESTFPQADWATARGTVCIVELVGDRPARVKTQAEVECKLLQEGERIESLFLGLCLMWYRFPSGRWPKSSRWES